ncbi:unnamed protein product [Darwinula stevensoni]|uniref:Ig-like domain-containing protein n=1 Tax=Darwinula stevensoni TaxID=69355 RepID=A0A7R8XFP4_9CRUS|nr:unnamed protein product [Darwinula stevensoni]CAG0891780.1 unnamed protein product [Darwinula stevensoni]
MYCVDRELSAYPRYRVVGDASKGEHHLQISDVRLEDDAVFECQVSPEPGSTRVLRSNATLIVLLPPTSIEMEWSGEGEGVVEVEEKKVVQVICKARDAKPPAEIQWFKNGRRLSPTPGKFFFKLSSINPSG